MAGSPQRPKHLQSVGDTPSKKHTPSEGPEIEVDQPAKYFAGDVIGSKYRLTNILGEGGMGSVWLARNLTLDIDVAIKLIRREMATREASQRLLQEARAAARIGHPSIVRIHDFGETEYRDPYIVMEVLKGESLRDLLQRKRRLPAAVAVQTLLPVASALSAAHAKQIVHRDLKPENVILSKEDTGSVVPKIVDFGIAKLHQDDVSRQATVDGTVLGSPDYMSPEQARGRTDIDERADVWAFSVVFYEALTGRTPFGGPNYNALIVSIMEDAPAPITNLGRGGDELWRILVRGLEKDRPDRWPNMREMGKALARWADAQGVSTDVAGTSIGTHWLGEGDRPLSSFPDEAKAPSQAPLVPSLVTRTEPPDAEAPRSPADVPTVVRRPTPARRRDRIPFPILAGAGAVVVGGFVVARSLGGSDGAAPIGAAPIGSAAAPAPSAVSSAPASPSAETAPPPSSAPAATTSAPAAAPTAPASPAEITACVRGMLADDAFPPEATPDLGYVCAQSDPRKGAAVMKSDVVRASGGTRVSDAMKEWSALGWYGMAAFATVRGRCCPAGMPPLALPITGTCAPLAAVLNDLAAAAASRADPEAAIRAHHAAIRCVAFSRASDYPVERPLEGPEESALRKTIERARR